MAIIFHEQENIVRPQKAALSVPTPGAPEWFRKIMFVSTRKVDPDSCVWLRIIHSFLIS